VTEAPVRAGVIAAGLGTRLASGVVKPLTRVAGTTLIDHVLTSIGDAGASEVVVIINADSEAIHRHVTNRSWPFALRWIVESTPSSMHSFLRVVETLAEHGDPGPFLISTVDTIAAPGAFRRFLAAAWPGADVTLAVTDRIDDEKPLYVKVDGSRVVALGEGARPTPFVTAGCYSVRASVLAEAAAARADGLLALRAFLTRLLERGARIDAAPIADTIDVDRLSDVDAAEAFLRRVAR
jgi:NDP-sugar pyrophosphorylase family protein